jgi:hypothetical protein
MIMSGKRTATVLSVQGVNMHGTLLVDVVYQVDGESKPRSARLGPEAVTGTPQVGDRVSVTFVMDVATALRVESAAT